VSVSKDAGKTWDKTLADRMPGFVKGAWVSKVMPSRFDAATVYVASDAHRLNDYETHIWVSHDFGATFQSFNGNLKGEAVKTLTEDQRNQDVIYAGTETGLFVSLDRGKNWSRLRGNFPDVRVDEITLHPRENAMLLATHGRSLWILDHISPIQEYLAAQGADAHLFSIDPALQWRSRRQERRVLGASVLRRREPADRCGDSVLPEERGERSEAEDHRFARQGRAHADGGAGAARGRDSDHVLGHAR
jgi:hypothetical protein